MVASKLMKSIFYEEDSISVGTTGILDSTEDDNLTVDFNKENRSDANSGLPDAIEGVEPYEADTNFEEECYNAIYRTDKALHAVFEAVGMYEEEYYMTKGREYVFTEAGFKGFIEKIKQIFADIITKIKQATEKLLVNVSAFFANGERYANKYEKEIIKGWTKAEKDETAPGYKGENLLKLTSADNSVNTIKGAIKGVQTTITNIINSLNDLLSNASSTPITKDIDITYASNKTFALKDLKKSFKKLKRNLLDTSKTIDVASEIEDDKEFRTEAMKVMYGEESPGDYKPSILVGPSADGAMLVKNLRDSRATIYDIKKIFNETLRAFKKEAENVLNDFKKLSNKDEFSSVTAYVSDAIQGTKDLNNCVFIIYMLAIKAGIQYYKQLKAVAKICVDKASEATDESYNMGRSYNRRGSGFLSDVIW